MANSATPCLCGRPSTHIILASITLLKDNQGVKVCDVIVGSQTAIGYCEACGIRQFHQHDKLMNDNQEEHHHEPAQETAPA